MAPKRSKKSCTNVDNGEKYKNLNISDVLCPICRSILIEPVTLPCNHSFCLACFNGTVENTTLTCPLCRTRIGSWLRSARKEKRVVNDIFWKNVQLKFANEVKKRLNGDDVIVDDNNSKVNIKLAGPGEIRREYEIQLERERSEIQKERDTEEKASEIVIKKILEEEQQAVKIEEEKLRLDEEIAKRLAAEDNCVVSSLSQKSVTKSVSKKSSIDKYLIALSKKKPESNNKSDVQPVSCNKNGENKINVNNSGKICTTTIMCQSRPKKQCSKAFQHLLLTKTLQYERADSNRSDSGDSIKQEMRYFKPIRLAPSVDKYQDGQIVHTSLIKLPTVHAKSNSTVVIRSPKINRTTPITPHPKSAFVSFNPINRNNSLNSVTIHQQPSIISETGKIIKQYYNKKRNALYSNVHPCTITSSSESPFLGFEMQTNSQCITVLNDFIKSLTQHVQGNIAHAVDKPTDKTVTENINVIKNEQKQIKNGCVPIGVRLKSKEINLQEQLDLEYARRLHEELNNPRQTRLTNKKTPTKTRSSPRKRQVTLEEIMTPKKFKI